MVGIYLSPLAVRLVDAGGFQWIARTVACEAADTRPAGKRPAVREPEAVPVAPGRRAVDCPPTELRVGDQVLAGGSFVDIVDLRRRHGATRT
ncbi:hypothetical protein [Streptomyces sp. NPDC059533]|uniref:hypothetical protein n=1 Tax=unclassified Streptomyces TaxID=2593676 RepID=UPI0036A81773